MSETKVVIAAVKENGDWINVESNEGKKIGINKTKNPGITAKLMTAKVGDEIIMSLWEKEDKIYGFDPKPNGGGKGGFGGKSFAPKDRGVEIAQACIQAAATTHSLTKDITPEKVMETAAKYMTWVNSQSTLKSQPINN